MLPMLRR